LPGGPVGSQKVLRQKSKVKFYFRTVRSRVIPILKRVEVGDYPSKIARIYGWSKQHVFYYLGKLQKAGLVRRKVRSNVVFYELTRKGQKLLTSCEGVVYGSGVFRLHRCFVKFPVLREGVYPRGDFRRVELVNWTALLGLERGVKVRHTTRHWIVHVEALYGRHPGELFVLAKNLADRVAKGLMLKYGCVLGEGGLVVATSWLLTILWPSCLAGISRFPHPNERWIIVQASWKARLTIWVVTLRLSIC
jgi:DNA-binding MarR family transcriptional regulator